MDTEDLRKALVPVLQQLAPEIQPYRHAWTHPVATTIASVIELRDFADGRSGHCPGPLKAPNTSAAYKYKDIKFVSVAAAAAAAAVLGPAHLPQYTPHSDSDVLEGDDGDVRHVSAALQEVPGDRVVTYWLPAHVTVRRAVEAALGYTPVKVEDYNTSKRVEKGNTLRWFDASEWKWLKVYK